MFHSFPQTASLTEGGKVAISPLPEIPAAPKRPVVPWAGEGLAGRVGKQPGLQGAGPTVLLCQQGGVWGSDPQKGASQGVCPSLGGRAGAAEATHPPAAVPALGAVAPVEPGCGGREGLVLPGSQ